ncbi:TMEM199/VMA12 family vacuolar ATPase assembly factor [Streptococcus suis]|nr:TMEM199/VMA12 family vacuolar ATPase assembly factor [Streptococcus suis]
MKRLLMMIVIFLSVFGVFFGLLDLPDNWFTMLLAVFSATLLSELAYRKWLHKFKEVSTSFSLFNADLIFALPFSKTIKICYNGSSINEKRVNHEQQLCNHPSSGQGNPHEVRPAKSSP